MGKTDADLIREIEREMLDHLAAMKKAARERILQLSEIDPDKAWEEVSGAVDAYGADMMTDATHWLRAQTNNYASARWKNAIVAQRQPKRNA